VSISRHDQAQPLTPATAMLAELVRRYRALGIALYRLTQPATALA
jgi:hypothetical protein